MGCQQSVNRVLKGIKSFNSTGCQQNVKRFVLTVLTVQCANRVLTVLTVLASQGVNNVNSVLTGC